MRIFFFCLLLCVPLASALGEYSFLLETGAPDTWHLLLFFKSCGGFEEELEIAGNARMDADFGESASLAFQASRELDEAALDSVKQKKAVVLQSPFSLSFYTMACFNHGVNALNAAAESARSAFKAVDAKQRELEEMIDAEYSGEAAGALSEAGEIKRDLSLRLTQGTGLGKKIVNASLETKGVWDSFEKRAEDSAQIVGSVESLVGEDGVLHDCVDLRDRLQKAVDALEKEKTATQFDAEIALNKAETLLERVKKEKLEEVSENAFSAVGSGAGIAARETVASFESDLSEAAWLVEEGKELLKQAREVYAAKNKAYCSGAILLQRKADGEAGKASWILQDVEDRSIVLEEALVSQAVAERTALLKAVGENWETNFWAAAEAQALLAENVGDAKDSIGERGPRINWLIGFIARLKEAEDALKQSASVQETEMSALNLMQELDELIAGADKDGLSASGWKSEASALRKSLESIPLTENNSVALNAITAKAGELIGEVKAAALEKYGSERNLVEQASVFAEFLSAADSQALAKAKRIVEEGVENRVGELKQTQTELEAILDGVKGRGKELIEKKMADGAVVEETVGESWLGGEATITTKIKLRNDSGLGFAGEIAFTPRSAGKALESGFAASKSHELRVSNGEIRIAGVEDGREYFVVLERNETIATVKDRKSRSTATESKATKTIELTVGCSRNAGVRLKESFDHAVSFAGANAESKLQEKISTGETGSAELLFNCREGVQKITITTWLEQPFKISRQYLVNGSELAIRFDFENKFGDLDSAAVGVLENAGCEVYGEKAFSNDGKATVKASGGVLALEFEAQKVPSGGVLAALVEASCREIEGLALLNGTTQTQNAEKPANKTTETKKTKETAAPPAEETPEESLKQAELTRFTDDLTPKLADAEKQFETNFATDDSTANYLKTSLFYQKARKALDAAVKSEGKMNAVLEKKLKDGGIPYTAEYLQKNNVELSASLSDLQTALSDLKAEARKQFELATAQQKQFGNATTAVQLEEIETAFNEGKLFIAVTKAKKLNATFFKAGSADGSAASGGFDFKLVFGGLGVGILIGLYYFLSSRKQDGFKLLE